jgi:hypothetical protein
MTQDRSRGQVAEPTGSARGPSGRVGLGSLHCRRLDPEWPKNSRRSLEHSGDRFVETTVRCPPSVPPPNTAPPRLRAITPGPFFVIRARGGARELEGRASVCLMARLGHEMGPWPTHWP